MTRAHPNLTACLTGWIVASSIHLSTPRAFAAAAPASPAAATALFEVDVAATLAKLLKDHDCDRDNLITTRDGCQQAFQLPTRRGDRLLVDGAYPLANLLMILSKNRDAGHNTVRIAASDLFKPVPEHLNRLITEQFWGQLTRRLDAQSLEENFADPKICANWCRRIYVPHGDQMALAYYEQIAQARPHLRLEIIPLAADLTPEYVKTLDAKPGILSLAMQIRSDGKVEPLPYIVPGGRFNEMYGWDSYFTAEGLLASGQTEMARYLVDHLVYQIKHYGKILNANRTYYLTRSQPPLLTTMALSVYAKLPKNAANREWLATVLRAAITEYHRVWMSGEHLVTTTGLNRYYGYGLRLPPEVDIASFASVLEPYARKHGMPYKQFAGSYDRGDIKEPQLDHYFLHDHAMRESGHDTTHRLAGQAINLNTVSLNSLLYKYEIDLAETIERVFAGSLTLPDYPASESAQAWEQRAKNRQAKMLALMWNDDQQLFFDYDFVKKRQTRYIAATTLYPLWAGLIDKETAAKLVPAALAKLEVDGGLVASSLDSLPAANLQAEQRQWDYPFGWAPHQMLAWDGLKKYGFTTIAERLQYRWLHTIVVNAARFNSAVTEKYDVVKQSLEAPVEYGNVGARFAFYPRGGFGWTNASFVVAWSDLPSHLTVKLEQLLPPEWFLSAPALGMGQQAAAQ